MTITRSDLEVLAQDAAFPDKIPYRSLSVRQIQELAQQAGMSDHGKTATAIHGL